MDHLLCILGHTAGGKTAFSVQLALETGAEIISADSRQVYRGMDIGTGKDLNEYHIGGLRVPVHLVDIMDAGAAYNLHSFKKDFNEVFHDINSRGKLALMCGGSGMYLEAILQNYHLLDVPHNEDLRAELEAKSFEELVSMLKLYGPLHNRSDTVSRKRMIRAIEIAMHQALHPELREELPELSSLVLGIRFERNERRRRITLRLNERLAEGMVEEVESLMKQGVSAEMMDYYGLEYRYISRYLSGSLSYEDMVQKLNTAIHQFAKRQMTYFRGMERRGTHIHWLRGEDGMDEMLEQALTLYESFSTKGH